MVEIDMEACIGCGICTEICPNFVFARKSEKMPGGIIPANPDLCCGCGHCVLFCPHNAIGHHGISAEAIAPERKSNISVSDVEALMMGRRSTRSFKPDDIPKSLIEQLVQIGINAGSAGNMQSESFIVVQDQGLLRKLEEMSIKILWNKGLKYATDRSLIGRVLAKRYPAEQYSTFKRYHNIIERRRNAEQLEGMIFRRAPCLIVLCGFKTEHLSAINCALAARNMELLAAASGLGTCWAGLFITAAGMGQKEINAALKISGPHQVYGALMVGYPKYRPSRVVHRKNREVRWL